MKIISPNQIILEQTFSIVVLLLLAALVLANTEGGCSKQDFGHGSVVCVCSDNYCDSLPSVKLSKDKDVLIITSSKDGLRWNTTHTSFSESERDENVTSTNYSNFSELKSDEYITNATYSNLSESKSNENVTKIHINASATFQSIFGFGGAFTDAAGMNIRSLTPKLQNLLIRSYYSAEGLEYNLGRIPIGGTDFSIRPYTYDDLDDNKTDESLKTFSLANEDYHYKIPIVQEALKTSDKDIKLIGSAWSAPTWMKDNHDIKGKGKLLKKYYHTWALYFSKFLEMYKKHNINFWGVTGQNEPIDGLEENFGFNAMGWTSEEQAEWIGNYLGPVLKERGHEHIKIMILDDNRLFLLKWVDVFMSNTVAASYVHGVAIHWYTDWLVPSTVLDLSHNRHPELMLLYTEACTGQWPWQPLKVVLGYWPRAESYAESIIDNLNHWVSGWTDWNLALDMKGGPNWAKNYVDSPIIVNAGKREFYKQPMYYILGHFSKFLVEGSIRIGVEISHSTEHKHKLMVTAFLRPDRTISLIILNKNWETINVEISAIENLKILHLTLEQRSITSVLWRQ